MIVMKCLCFQVAGGEQKSLYKKMAREGGASDIVALSPPSTNYNYLSKSTDSSDGGDYLTADNLEMFVVSRKTLFNLVTTLNLSFYPDYDFSDAKSHEFARAPSLSHVWAEIDSRLGLSPLYNKGLRFVWFLGDVKSIRLPLTIVFGSKSRSRLWEEIDREIGGLRNAEIYTYKSDLTSDPFSDPGCGWYFNFFFYNVKLKRIVFFTCRAIRYIVYTIDWLFAYLIQAYNPFF